MTKDEPTIAGDSLLALARTHEHKLVGYTPESLCEAAARGAQAIVGVRHGTLAGDAGAPAISLAEQMVLDLTLAAATPRLVTWLWAGRHESLLRLPLCAEAARTLLADVRIASLIDAGELPASHEPALAPICLPLSPSLPAMHYLIAYDIADPRRLRRVARRLERGATRCQKSVFLYHGGPRGLISLLDELTPLIDPEEDIVQAWSLSANQPAAGIVRGLPAQAFPAGVVLAPQDQWFVPGRE